MKFIKVTVALLPIIILLNCSESNSKKVGLLDRLFNKNKKADTAPPAKTAEMLDEEIFWAIVDRSLKGTTNQDDQEQFLIAEIEKLSPAEIVGFRLRTDYLLYNTYTSDLWCAGYIMNGGCSDDGFEYFRCWIISRGKDTYYNAKANADYLVHEAADGMEFYDFESFWYVALEAFTRKTGKDLYDYIDNETFKTREGSYPDLEFTWQEDEPESMKKICPKLYDRFNN